MNIPVRNEIWRIVVFVPLVLFVGFVLGRPLVVALVAAVLYSGYLLINLIRLQKWEESNKQTILPDATGLWGDVFNRLHLLEKEAAGRFQELESMAVRFQEAASALPDAMVILGRDHVIEWVNPMAERLLGFNQHVDIGRPITNLIRHPGFRAFLAQPGSGEGYEMQSPALAARQLVLRKVPYGASQELLIARDMTRLHKLEIMRSQFVANVSHELRSPLTVISGYLETLNTKQENDPEVLRQAISRMYVQAKRMERLVADLLELSRLETEPDLPGSTSVDVAAMLAGLVESAKLLSGEAEHRIKLEAAEGLKLRGNPSELQSLFSNLINNAVLYTPAGGQIGVSWKRERDEAVFSVTDSGPGIAPQHIPRITERFYRVDVDRSRETGGTGLGLAIVKHVIERYDGKLEIISELGKGSTFRCRFPASRITQTAA